MEEKYTIILFDGVCNFCHSSVNFIIRRDSMRRFKFASLQSSVGQDYLSRFPVPVGIDSVILIEEGKCYTESTAALKISKHLDGVYSLLYILILIPKPIRDFCYRWFAKRRYKYFGVQNTCMIPKKEDRERFILDNDETR
ncbi:DCC1-like thiol-disulfide oxidoreductase family protein [Bacillus sp. 31A1R]|uniref:DCC1-like thiol-disulfide oxidoreductase family protein n=1 Tax=Robertmurraya mangrovi TaxID=3098077 RepID=A0ABU5IVS9_9BACI|nr:DCC1-like thiol-disulfide oxidoreductase family protein [Bacillus sp. 31A1R]MDZ5471248.1 DCC1-like thiol-disulfide oxidoreductase family protein [Bacillus sp. 31A1R]